VLAAIVALSPIFWACSDDPEGNSITSTHAGGDALDGVITDPDGGDGISPPDVPEPDTSTVCVPDCLPGYTCKNVGTGPHCVVDGALACKKCTTPAGCLGGACELVGGKGPFCLIPCTLAPKGGSSCPDGYACVSDAAAPGGNVCKPLTDDCTCTAANLGQVQPCTVQGSTCNGGRTCTSKGWGDCAAISAQPEVCDGLDNDCDGKTDEGLKADASCSIDNADGSCPGVWTCAGLKGLQCEGTAAAAETCDAEDNDCDGLTDEPWLVGGVYTGDKHCGACGNDCTKAYANGVGACNPAGKPPHCIVAACAPGYVLGDKGCVEKPEPCPGGDCTCTAADDGKERSCQVKNAAGVCEGVEHCDAGKGWVGCTARTPQQEVCNGLDDDCDGVIDDGVSDGAVCNKASPHGTCGGKLHCKGSAGWLCDAKEALAEQCNKADDDCDGKTDEDFLGDGGLYLTLDHCGACNKACKPALTANTVTACKAKSGKAVCETSCIAGFHDANKSAIDGCECKFVSKVDEPGGGDLNCDGVDGDLQTSYFVAKHGKDSNPGTRSKPFATIGRALKAVGGDKRNIYVAAGQYPGNLILAGVRLFGGFSQDFATHDPQSNETTISGIADPTADSVAVWFSCGLAKAGEDGRLSGMTVQGADAAAGRSSTAILLQGCGPEVRVDHNRVVAGHGGAGLPGAAGTNGKPGVAGTAGLKAKDTGHPNCFSFDTSKGGKGGALTCGNVTVSGGAGGNAVCPDYHADVKPPQCSMTPPWKQVAHQEEFGKAGSGVGGGGGGVPGWDGYIDPNNGKTSTCKSPGHGCNRCETGLHKVGGDNGTPGKDGTSGFGGLGCTGSGKMVGGTYVGNLGAVGKPGQPGGGGGGGGASGGVEVVSCQPQAGYSDIGGSGGGGGSGGCQGNGGQPGKPGGASFGVVIVGGSGAPVKLDSNAMWGGKGGRGGAGGAGGYGGFGAVGRPGGKAGAGTPKTFCAYAGGAGGNGGAGGHGGGGGGGCGGPAALIATVALPKAAVDKLVAANDAKQGGVPGDGGPGGASPKHYGNNGGIGKGGVILSW